jgi:OmpA-OmpF porin, OOP family
MNTNFESNSMIGKISWLSVCFIAIITQAGAQVGIEVNGGLQGTHYQLQNGQDKPLPGGSLGLDYTFRLGDQWGLLTGIIGGIYRTQATLPDGLAFTYNQVDDEGSAFQYNLKAIGYKETQRFFAASIPLLLQYHTAGEGTQWWLDAGGKVLFPFNSSIQITAKQLSLQGYYPDFNLEVSNLPQHGFGTLKGWKTSATTELKPAASLSAATGFSFKVQSGSRLYVGLYADYGLTNVKEKNGTSPLVTYNPSGISGIQASSVLNMPNAGQVTLLSFGLQVRLGFGAPHARPAREHKTRQISPRPVDSSMSNDDSDLVERPVVFGLLGETAIPEFQKPHLDEVATLMKQHPAIRISIVGHSCGTGSEMEDPSLGDTRAKAVARYLEDKGIDPRRMDVSFVHENDLAQASDAAANYQSRRVEITMK